MCNDAALTRAIALNNIFKSFFFNKNPEIENGLVQKHPINRIIRDLIKVSPRFYTEYIRTSKFYNLKSVFDHLQKVPIEVLKEFVEYHNTPSRIKQKGAFHFYETVTFDYTLFTLLHEMFWKKVEEYQLTTVVDLYSVKKKIEEVNKKRSAIKKNKYNKKASVTRKLNPTQVLLASFLVQQNFSLEELKKTMPKTSYHRLSQDLKDVGISMNHTDLKIHVPNLDYQDYKLYFSKFHRESK